MIRVLVMTLALVGFGLPVATQFRSSIAGVRVDVLVTDGRRPVTGLTAQHFEIRDNGVRQDIVDVQYETLPLNVVCVLDLSGSVAGPPLEHLKQAYTSVIDALAGGDRGALVTFATKATLHSALTDDRARLRTLADRLGSEGATSLYDAVFTALALREADQGRTLLLLLSDGRDTSSWLTARKVVDAARRTDVVVYPVTVTAAPPVRSPGRVAFTPPDEVAANQFLGALADETGGRVVSADRESRLPATLLAIVKEFRERYVVSYTPTGVAAGGWHAIDVRVKGRNLTVRARRGYGAN